MSHILPGHNGLKNTVPLWIQPVSCYSLTGSRARVSPGGRIAAPGPSRHGQRLPEPRTSAEMLLPSILALLWLLLLLPGELLPTPDGRIWGFCFHRGAPKGTGGRGGEVWELLSLSAQAGCWGNVALSGLQAWFGSAGIQKFVSWLMKGEFLLSGFCHIRVEVGCFNVQDIVFLKNAFYLRFWLSLL